MTTNAFNPMIPLLQGQQFEQGLSQAELEGLQLRERQALRKAAGKFGQGNYFAGMEGIPGAERPDAIKDAYASGDIETAMKLEALASENAKLERGIGIAGRTELAKKTSDYNALGQMIKDLEPTIEQQDNVLGTRLTAPQAGEAPSSPAVGEPTERGLAGLPAVKRSIEVGTQGVKYKREPMTALEQEQIKSGIVSQREATALGKKNFQQKAEQDAVQNIRDTQNQIAEQERLMPLRQGSPGLLQQLRQQLERQRKEYSDIATGKVTVAPAPTSAPQAPVEAAPAPIPAPARGPGLTPAPALPSPAGPTSQQTPALNEYELAARAVKDRDEKITAANKEIVNARLGVEKVTKFLPQIKALHALVTTQNIGHPEMESVPGAASALSLNRSNAQVKKLNEAIINMFAEPGQSQMMNTIIERQMQGAVVPGLFTEPQLNKINSSILMSNVEHLRNFPTFLEKWQKQHQGELTGAADAWIDYTDHNPRYGYKKDARGRVTVYENKHVIAPETWQYLRENKMVRSIGSKTFIKQKDGSWAEK